MLSATFIVLAVLLFKSYSAVIVNNVELSSDVLKELFFNEIKNNKNKLNISIPESKDYNSYKCFLALFEIVMQFPNLEVLPFFDAWGKIPSGLLKGNMFDIGNFDQCVETSVTLSKLTGVVNGQYCFVSIPVSQNISFIPTMEARLDLEINAILNSAKINIGICVPDICSSELINKVFQSFASTAFDGALSGLTLSSCTNGKTPEYRTIHIVGITFFILIGAVMIFSSIYEFLMTLLKKSPKPISVAFSMISNGKILFTIITEKSQNTIGCLTGIRVFSMIWIMYSHSYLFSAHSPFINWIDIKHWSKQVWSMHVLNSVVAVDSFFFISGLLVAWLGFQELDRTNGKLNVIMMYVHRYIRLTPLLAAMILFNFSLDKLIVTGPFRQLSDTLETCNGYNWWPILLYIQNYFVREPADSQCLPYSWYLAIDFQLYVLSPLLLIPMWKWGKKFAPILVILSLLSIGCVMATYFIQGYTDLTGASNQDEFHKTYAVTHTRYSPWLVGFGLGYFMHVHREKTFRLHKAVNLLGWIVSFAIFGSILFAPYYTITSSWYGSVVEAAMYESLKRVSWAIALAWITFACHSGFGGVVDSFLSHPIWQPLGRLTYALYLIHIPMIRVDLGSLRAPKYFSDFREILSFWSLFGMSLTAAIAMSLAFESPLMVLEKEIFRKPNRQARTCADTGTAPSAAPPVAENI